jgi:hypothetical protein
MDDIEMIRKRICDHHTREYVWEAQAALDRIEAENERRVDWETEVGAHETTKARLRRIEEAARDVFQNPLDLDAMLELGEALGEELVRDREQPNPPLWQQNVVREKGMCGALVRGTDGQDAICILDRGHGRGVHAWYPSEQQPI